MKKTLIILATVILIAICSVSVLACAPGCGHENMDAIYLYDVYTHRLETEGFDFSTWYRESLEYFDTFSHEGKHCQPIYEDDGSVISVKMFTEGTATDIIYYPMMIDGMPCYQNEAGELIYGTHHIVAYELWTTNHKARIIERYKENIAAGKYYHTNNAYYVTIIDGRECYQTLEGQFFYGTELLYNKVSTLDRIDKHAGELIASNFHTAIYYNYESNFITIYNFGEITTIINTLTGNTPRG